MRRIDRKLLQKLESWKDRDAFPGGGEDWDAPHVDDVCELVEAVGELLLTPKYEVMPLENATENQRYAFCLAEYSSAVQNDGLVNGVIVNNTEYIPIIEAAANKHKSKSLQALIAKIREEVPAEFFKLDGDGLAEKLEEHESIVETLEEFAESEEHEQVRCEAMRLAAVIALSNPDEFFKPA
jgi:hypothetical protein